MIKPSKPGFAVSLLVFAIGFGACGEAARWFQSTFLESEVHGARLLPPFSVPVRGESSASLNFLAVGDAGTGGRGQRLVAESMARKAAEDTTSLVLFLGDNIYESGVSSVTDLQWDVKFESVYRQPSLQIPFLAVLGNHDYYLNPQAQVEYTNVSRRWTMPDRFYTRSFFADDSTEIQFFCLDTRPMSATHNDTSSFMPQLRWLESALSGSRARWKIVAGHHTIYSNGNHGNNPYLGSFLEPLFIRYGVTLYLSGHDHDLQLLEPVGGVHYVVSGAGGKHRDTWWKDNTIYAATNLGFTWISVAWSDVIVEFFDTEGNLRYSHVIRKQQHDGGDAVLP